MVGKSCFWQVAGFVMALLLSASASATVEATLDRIKIYETETATLTLVVRGDNDAEPDFDGLKDDFDLLATSRSSSFSYSNGRMESKRSWFITLAPKRRGKLTVPAIEVGSESSRPLMLEVLAPSAADAGDEVPAIFMETRIEPEGEVYVQGQIALSIKIFYATELQSGRLTELDVADAVVQRLGDDKSYTALRHGKRYNVFERRYAIFPQHSGELTIPSLSFRGSVRLASQGRRGIDPFFDPFGRLGAGSKQVRVKSDVKTVRVLPRPAEAKGRWWLPARELELSEQWSPEPPEFRVGEPVTRTITLRAKGLSATQLPDLPLGEVADINSYPDQALTHDEEENGWIIGSRQQKVALIPVRAGQYTLPGITLQWWDSEANAPRSAHLPARTITVLPAAKAEEAAPAAATPARPLGQTDEAEQPPAVVEVVEAGYWPYVSAALLLLWMLTILGWWRERRREAKASAQQERPPARPGVLKKRLKRACDRNDPKAARDALLQWAAALAPEAPPTSLGQLAGWFEGDGAKEIEALDRALYAAATDRWQGAPLWRAIAPRLDSPIKPKRAARSDPDSALAPLYPRR